MDQRLAVNIAITDDGIAAPFLVGCIIVNVLPRIGETIAISNNDGTKYMVLRVKSIIYQNKSRTNYLDTISLNTELVNGVRFLVDDI